MNNKINLEGVFNQKGEQLIQEAIDEHLLGYDFVYEKKRLNTSKNNIEVCQKNCSMSTKCQNLESQKRLNLMLEKLLLEEQQKTIKILTTFFTALSRAARQLQINQSSDTKIISRSELLFAIIAIISIIIMNLLIWGVL